MTTARKPISAEGKAKAEAELAHLKQARRQEIVEAIKAAREFGDLKENAEYHAARDAQAMNEARIRTLERQLAEAVVAEAAPGDEAGVGSVISYRDADGGEAREVTLVNALEADVAAGKLSVESPMGAALLGAGQGDEVTFETPRGDAKRLEVLSVG
jgi:transcription elongation factor GreA